MWHVARTLTAVLALGALSTGAAQAQVTQPRGAAGNDVITLNVYGGGYAPTSTIAPGTDFDNSGTVGLAATVWLHRYVGIRANALYAQTNAPVGAPASLDGESPHVWAYSGDVMLRLPRSAGERTTWFPYVVGGLGAKTYDFELVDTATDFAGSFGGGIEYRLDRVGLQAEVRDIVSSFERFGINETQHDVVWTAGITVSF